MLKKNIFDDVITLVLYTILLNPPMLHHDELQCLPAPCALVSLSQRCHRYYLKFPELYSRRINLLKITALKYMTKQ